MKGWPALVLAAVVCWSAVARAQDFRRRDAGFIGKDIAVLEIDDCAPAPQVTPEQLIRIASEHFERGETLYVQGDYKGAVKELVTAYCIKPYYSILKDIGQAYERELDYERAIAYLERYVMEVPKDATRTSPCAPDPQDDKRNVTARIKVLQNLGAKIRINTEPGDAEITLSNEAGLRNRGKSGEELEVLGGRYDILIERKGYVPITQEIRAEVGKPYTLFARLEPKKGKVRVRVVPANARLFVDQKQVGIGAYESELPGGRYTLTAEAPGRITQSREIEVLADRETPIVLDLPEQPQTGRRQFIAYATAAGAVAGGALAGVSSEPAVVGTGAAVGGVAGFFGSYFVTPNDIPLGTSSLTITVSLIGGTAAGATTALFTGDGNRIAPAIGVGLALGGVGGYYLGSLTDITPGDAALINSAAVWGTVVGALFTSSFDASENRRIQAGLVLSGLGMGSVGGVLLTRYFSISRTHAQLIDLGGVVGLFVGAAIDNVVAQANENQSTSSERTANYTLGGLATGLILAGVLTRNIDTPKLAVTPVVSRTQATGVSSSAMTFGVAGSF